LAYWFLGNGLMAAIMGGLFWLLALKALYKMGWIKSLVIAVLIWILATVVGFFLPTLSGPL
jgi:pilus assembly protein TadC